MVHLSVSVASFEKDQLVGCADMTGDAPKNDAGVSTSAIEDGLFKLLADDAQKSKTSRISRINRTCGEQFQDRPLFASCANTIAAGRASMAYRTFVYSFDRVFGDDKLMRQCLDSGGDWKAMQRNSDEFREARLHRDMGNLRKMVGRAADEP